MVPRRGRPNWVLVIALTSCLVFWAIAFGFATKLFLEINGG